MPAPKLYNFLIYNHHPTYQAKIATMVEQSKPLDYIDISQISNPIISSPSVTGVNLVREIIPFVQQTTGPKINAIFHRNEHGLLHCTPAWNTVVDFCLDNNMSAMSFDFGYFDHYKHYMVDYYQRNCVSSIYKEWDTNQLSETADWSKALPSIQAHRDKILDSVNQAKNDRAPKILRGKKYVVIWAQWTTELIRHCFYENNKHIAMHHWITMLSERIQQAGMIPVIKLSPVKVTKPFESLQHQLICFVGRKAHLIDLPGCHYAKQINAHLIAGAEQHIICCSSVSNELVISGAKVTSMGRSWFDNLGIFHEPKTWDDVLNYQQPLDKNVNKWINWWMSRQCLKDDIHSKMVEVYEKSRANV